MRASEHPTLDGLEPVGGNAIVFAPISAVHQTFCHNCRSTKAKCRTLYLRQITMRSRVTRTKHTHEVGQSQLEEVGSLEVAIGFVLGQRDAA